MSKATNIAKILDQATTFAVSVNVGANVIANTTVVSIGNSTVNSILTQSSLDLGGNAQLYSSIYKANNATAGPDEVDSFTLATIRGVDFFYTLRDVTSGANNIQIGRIGVVQDGGDAYYNEYGVVFSNTAAGTIGSFSANANTTHTRLYFNPAASMDYQIKLAKISIKV